ncbi:MAG TPA: energy-coupling factor ABC transporter permease, partial [Candidatus Limnocylindrales bacterium]
MELSIVGPVTWPFPPAPPQMHAPDGFLTIPVAAVMWLLTLVCVGIALRQANRTLDERSVPLMGIIAA